MRQKHVWFGLQAVVTVLLVLVLWRRFDWARFSEVFSKLPLWFYVGSLAAVSAGQLLYALRWRVILARLGIALSFGEVLRQHLIGLCFGNILPTGVGGDAAKVLLLGRTAGYLEVTASVFVDRFLGFFWLALGGAALAWSTASAGDAPVYVLNRNLLTGLAAGFIATIAAVWILPVDGWISRWSPARWQASSSRLVGGVRLVRRALEPVSMAASGAVTLGYAWLMAEVYRVYFAVAALPTVSLAAAALVVVSVAIFVNVPLSINGIGLREQLHVLLLSSLGIPTEASVLIALLLFAHMLMLSVAGLAIWLRMRPTVPQIEGVRT